MCSQEKEGGRVKGRLRGMKEGRRVKTEAEKGSVDDWLKIRRTLGVTGGWMDGGVL